MASGGIPTSTAWSTSCGTNELDEQIQVGLLAGVEFECACPQHAHGVGQPEQTLPGPSACFLLNRYVGKEALLLQETLSGLFSPHSWR